MWFLKLLLWIIFSSVVISAAPQLMYSAADLYKLRHVINLPLLLLNHQDIMRRLKYIHCGFHQKIRISSAKPECGGKIRSFWSTNPRLPKNAGRSVLTPLLRSDFTHSALLFALFNVRSLSNKTSLIHEHIQDQNIDFMCMTETCQKPNDYFHLNQTSGYPNICNLHCSGKGHYSYHNK